MRRCANCGATRARHDAGPVTLPRGVGEPDGPLVACPAFAPRASWRVRWANRALRVLS